MLSALSVTKLVNELEIMTTQAVEKSNNHIEQPMSEASIEARAAGSVISHIAKFLKELVLEEKAQKIEDANSKKLTLTMNMLNCIPPLTIIATGLSIDGPEGINLTNSKKELRWVLKLGGFKDWVIYVGPANNTIEEIERNGDKIGSPYNLAKLIDFSPEVEQRYRY